jgi:hypothetical protein
MWTYLYDQMDISLPLEVGGRLGIQIPGHSSPRYSSLHRVSGTLCGRAATGSQNLWLVTLLSFSIELIPSSVSQCELNDYGGGDSDDSDGDDTHQHVYNTRKCCIRIRSRPRVHPSPHSAKPSTTPIDDPMATVRKGSSTLGMRTIHVCLPHSPSPNQHTNPLRIPTVFHSTMHNPLLEPPRSP